MATAAALRRLASRILLRRLPLSPLASLRFPPPPLPSSDLRPVERCASNPHRHFSSTPKPPRISRRFVEDHGDEESGAESHDEEDVDEDESEHLGPGRVKATWRTDAEKAAEAEEIGYQVVGPLEATENPFKPYEPLFAVVQIGSHQFKVSNGDSIFAERLKYCEVNDKLVLNRVLMLGSSTQTIIGRPILPEAIVHAVVEEHALDAKVIIFKKKRRKNYRRTKGHRQELTKLRITCIQGIEKPVNMAIAA